MMLEQVIFMNQDTQNQTAQDPSKLHPLMPVDAAGKPVNITAFRPGGKESEAMMLPPDAFKNVAVATEAAPTTREEGEDAPTQADPKATASAQVKPEAVVTLSQAAKAPVITPEVAAAGVARTHEDDIVLDVKQLDLMHPATPQQLEVVKKEAKMGTADQGSKWVWEKALKEFLERQIEYQHSHENLPRSVQ